MTPLRTPTNTIFQVNFQLLVALVQVLIAVLIWPNDLHWWGLGLISILCILVAASLLLQAMKSIWTVVKRERALKEFLERGKSPKSARFVDDETLDKEGML